MELSSLGHTCDVSRLSFGLSASEVKARGNAFKTLSKYPSNSLEIDMDNVGSKMVGSIKKIYDIHAAIYSGLR